MPSDSAERLNYMVIRGSISAAGILAVAVVGCGDRANLSRFQKEVALFGESGINIDLIWNSPVGDPNLMESAAYIELGGDLWALGDFSRGIGRFSLAEPHSELYEREGDGPGEFRDIVYGLAHPSGDTLVVIQEERVTYVTLDAQAARTFASLAPGAGRAIAPDGSHIIAEHGIASQRGAIGNTLHRIAPDGSYLRSFRRAEAEELIGDPYIPLSMGVASESVWIILQSPSGFRLEEWDISAERLVRSHPVSASWWRPADASTPDYESLASAGKTGPSLPSGAHAIYDDGSVLWIAARHGDHRGYIDMDGGSTDTWFDGVLFAVDRASGQPLGARAFDEIVQGFTNLGHLVLYSEAANGSPRVQLATFSLRR